MGSQDILSDLFGGSSEKEVPLGRSGTRVAWDTKKMATYFERSLSRAKWYKGFIFVNKMAMASQFGLWRNSGKTEADVKALIDLYMKEDTPRGRVPGWRDFLYRAEQLAARVDTIASVTSEEVEEDPLDRAMRIGTLEAFLEAFPDRPGTAELYYQQWKEENAQG